MNQVFIGAAIPFLVALFLYTARKGQASLPLLILTPVFMAMGVILAVFPDIPRLLGNMELYHKLARDAHSDLYLWHYSIDLVEGDAPWYTLGVVLMSLSLIAAAWRELNRTEEL